MRRLLVCCKSKRVMPKDLSHRNVIAHPVGELEDLVEEVEECLQIIRVCELAPRHKVVVRVLTALTKHAKSG
jgi:hypothetical protein